MSVLLFCVAVSMSLCVCTCLPLVLIHCFTFRYVLALIRSLDRLYILVRIYN